MIILRIRARDVATLIAQQGYDTIRIYRDALATGPFTTLVGSINPLLPTQEYYEFADPGGVSSNFYEFSYFKTAGSVESNKSQPFIGSITTGPLGLLTIGYVWATTELPDLGNAPGSIVGEYILRAETLMQYYGSLYGGFLVNSANWAQVMPIAVRILLEDLWIKYRPANRMRQVSGIMSEKIGHYSYTAGPPRFLTNWKDLFPQELQLMIRPFLAGMRYKVHVKTSQVFVDLKPIWTPLTPNADPNSETRLWNDYLDIDYMPYSSNLRLGPAGQSIFGHEWST